MAAATWNGSVLHLDNTQTTGGGGGLVWSPTTLGCTIDATKSYIVSGWCLWVDTAGTAAKLQIGQADNNDGTTGTETYRASGWSGEVAGVPGYRYSWTSAPGTAISFATGKGLVIASSVAGISISGYVMVRTL